MKIFILEDDENECNSYVEEIRAFAEEHNKEIEIIIKKNLEDALEIVNNESFDVAIIDLNLGGPEDSSGNIVIKEINKKMRIPIYIVSGTINAYEEIEELYGKDLILKKITRGEKSVFEILEDICKLYDTGIIKVLNKNGILDDIMNDIFLNYSVNLINSLKEKKDIPSSEKEKIVSRFCATIISEKLKHISPKYHPCEIYFTPPLKSKITTGDIIKNIATGKMNIILTPACDLEIRENGKRKVERALIVEIYKSDELYRDYYSSQKQTNFIQSLKAKKIKEYYEYLPLNENSGYVIDFNKISSLEILEIESEFTRESSLNETFLKEIIFNFSKYYGKQGIPELH